MKRTPWGTAVRPLFVMLLAVALIAGMQAPSLSQAPRQVVIAMTGDAETMDPHFSAISTTSSFQDPVIEALFDYTPDGKIKPVLAESYRLVNPTTWEIKLRPNVRYHNGEPFNAESVRFNIDRALNHPKSLQKAYVSFVRQVQIVDPLTVRLVTSAPFPDMIDNLNNVKMHAPNHAKQAGDDGLAKRMVGTGPYKFVEWVRDERMVLERNEQYWGTKPDAPRVIYRPIPEDATRLAALLSREVDVIEGVPLPDVPRLKKTQGFQVLERQGPRLIYLGFDAFRDRGGRHPAGSPGLPEGAPNPFKSKQVRQAFWYAINTKEIVERVLDGHAAPADEVIAPFMFGYTNRVRRPTYDPSRAKRLLTEAGFPNGFKLTMVTPTDRYVNDKEVAQAAAAQLRRIGIDISVQGFPRQIYFAKQMRQFENTFHLGGWLTLISSINYTALIGCVDPRKPGYGRANYGRFCSPESDRLIDMVNAETDPAKRRQLFAQLAEFVREEVPKIPLYYEALIRGARAGIEMPVRVDELVLAHDIKVRR